MPQDNRAALLAGARRCLERRGFARTRARDVAAEAGVSLAAIGYHFGSVDALLVTALTAGIEQWGARARLEPDGPGGVGPEGFERAWARWREAFDEHRGVLAASFELIAQADDRPEVRDRLRDVLDRARRELAAALVGVDPDVEPARAAAVGAVAYAALSGFVVQWLVDPAAGPDAAGIRRAFAELGQHVAGP